MNTSTAPIFLQFNCFRENIWVIFKVQFHFLYIFVGRVDRIRKTSHITMLSFYLFPSNLQSFGDELNRSSKTAPANIWAHKNWKQIFWYFKLRFHNELLHWQKNCCLVFSRAGLHLHVRKIWTLSVKHFKLFLQKNPIFWTPNVQILFFWLNICIFTPVKTQKIVFGRKMSKIWPFTFYHFFTL